MWTSFNFDIIIIIITITILIVCFYQGFLKSLKSFLYIVLPLGLTLMINKTIIDSKILDPIIKFFYTFKYGYTLYSIFSGILVFGFILLVVWFFFKISRFNVENVTRRKIFGLRFVSLVFGLIEAYVLIFIVMSLLYIVLPFKDSFPLTKTLLKTANQQYEVTEIARLQVDMQKYNQISTDVDIIDGNKIKRNYQEFKLSQDLIKEIDRRFNETIYGYLSTESKELLNSYLPVPNTGYARALLAKDGKSYVYDKIIKKERRNANIRAIKSFYKELFELEGWVLFTFDKSIPENGSLEVVTNEMVTSNTLFNEKISSLKQLNKMLDIVDDFRVFKDVYPLVFDYFETVLEDVNVDISAGISYENLKVYQGYFNQLFYNASLKVEFLNYLKDNYASEIRIINAVNRLEKSSVDSTLNYNISISTNIFLTENPYYLNFSKRWKTNALIFAYVQDAIIVDNMHAQFLTDYIYFNHLLDTNPKVVNSSDVAFLLNSIEGLVNDKIIFEETAMMVLDAIVFDGYLDDLENAALEEFKASPYTSDRAIAYFMGGS
ncbi:MAG: hypothetical protein ACOX4W_03390 [Bacilli bacterium]